MAQKNYTSEQVETTTSPDNGRVLQTILLVILVLLSAFQVAFLLGITPSFNKTAENNSNGMEKIVRDALLQHEYSKVGGEENYKTITDLQIALLKHPQYEGNIDSQKAMLLQLGGTGVSTATNTDTPTVTEQSLTDDQKVAVLSGAVVEGNRDAEIMVIEYSEMECPYCAQQYHDTQLKKQLTSEFGDKIAFVYKSNRGVDHPGTEAKALGLLCAQRFGGDAAYTKFYEYVMDNTTLRPKLRDGVLFPVSSLADAAKAAGVTDMTAWQNCVDNKETLSVFAAQTREAGEFGLRGTPGTLIFNTKTGKYTTISGAYPYDQFQGAVQSLIGA